MFSMRIKRRSTCLMYVKGPQSSIFSRMEAAKMRAAALVVQRKEKFRFAAVYLVDCH